MSRRKVTMCAACGRRTKNHEPDLILCDLDNGDRDRYYHTTCGGAAYAAAAQKPALYRLTVRHIEGAMNRWRGRSCRTGGDGKERGGCMNVFVNGAQLTLLVAMSGIALISAVALALCIRDENAVFAWVWAVVFALTSLLAAWSLWRLV